MSLDAAPFSLSNVTVADAYGAATLQDAPPGDYISVSVTGAAVYYRLQRDGVWDNYETFLGPWVGTLYRPATTGIAFRNAAASPAQVTAAIQDTADQGSVPSYTVAADGTVDTGASGALVTGDIVWAAVASREGCLLCDGSFYDSVADTSLAPLYAAIGLTFGGSGPSDFAVPDLRDRVAVGAGNNTALAASDGVAAANRHGTRHRHSPHAHNIKTYTGSATFQGIAAANPPGGQEGNESSDDADGGSGITTDPVDGAAFLGLYAFIAK